MADARETKTQSFKQNEENGYIREQIVKKKRNPIQTCIRVGIGFLAVFVAGCAAGASYAFVNHWFDKQEETSESTPSHTISYHETSTSDLEEGESLEETFDNSDVENEGNTSLEESEWQTDANFVLGEWLDAYLETREYTIEDVEKMEHELSKVYGTIQKSIVSIEVSEKLDENIEVTNDINEISGIIVSVTETEVILLVDGNLFTESAVLTAYPNTYKERVVEVRQRDSITGVTALAMSVENFSESEYKSLQAVTLGNSNRMDIGDMVILAGKPIGICGSMQYGFITYIERNIGTVDGEMRLLWTDCIKSENSSGAMFNLDGELMGWLVSSSENIVSENSSLQQNSTLQNAIGITDLKTIIEDVILGKNSAYLGIKGCAVTDSMMSQYGLPKGIYITEVEPMSAAYQGGIQMGDVITKVNGTSITNLKGLQYVMGSLEDETEVTIVIQRKGIDKYKERTITLTLQGR